MTPNSRSGRWSEPELSCFLPSSSSHHCSFIHQIHPFYLWVVTPNTSSSPAFFFTIPHTSGSIFPMSFFFLLLVGVLVGTVSKSLESRVGGGGRMKERPCPGWRLMAADNGTVPSSSYATIQEQSHRSPSEVKWLLDSQWLCGWKLLLGWIYCWSEREKGGCVIHPFTWK